jgi:hypothetical protein
MPRPSRRRARLRPLPPRVLLVEKPRLTFAARPVKLAPHLLDGEPQMRDQNFGARDLGARPRQFGITCGKQSLQYLDIIRKRIIAPHHQQ